MSSEGRVHKKVIIIRHIKRVDRGGLARGENCGPLKNTMASLNVKRKPCSQSQVDSWIVFCPRKLFEPWQYKCWIRDRLKTLQLCFLSALNQTTWTESLLLTPGARKHAVPFFKKRKKRVSIYCMGTGMLINWLLAHQMAPVQGLLLFFFFFTRRLSFFLALSTIYRNTFTY